MLGEVVHPGGNKTYSTLHIVRLHFFSRLLLHQSLIWKLLCLFSFQPYGKVSRNFLSGKHRDLIRCNNLWRRKHRDLIRCLDIRLKKVVLKNYRGIKAQVNFASFFVLNAKMLELMRFEISKHNDNEVFIAEQHRLLQLEKRASRGAQFYFTTGRRCHRYPGCYLNHIKHVNDLSITDPFELACSDV